jgi:putative PIN family toxin of toxin-antitoxin system
VRIVLDTNVFLSGVFFGGPPYQILDAWRRGEVQILLSPEILEEYQRVSARLATQFPEVDFAPFLKLVTVQAEIIVAPPLAEAVCEDPADDKFLACAIAGQAACVVSGDKHLLKIKEFRKIPILKPRTFVDKFLKTEEEGPK